MFVTNCTPDAGGICSIVSVYGICVGEDSGLFKFIMFIWNPIFTLFKIYAVKKHGLKVAELNSDHFGVCALMEKIFEHLWL